MNKPPRPFFLFRSLFFDPKIIVWARENERDQYFFRGYRYTLRDQGTDQLTSSLQIRVQGL